MKGSRFNEEQIIAILKQQEAGKTIAVICRENGVSEATFYKWKSRYGGMSVGEAKRARELEQCSMRIRQTRV